MAASPTLVVGLEARLDKFEKQLAEAGVIAERAVSRIEETFAKSNPTLGSFGGGLAGGFLGAGGFREVERIAKQLLEVNNTIAKIGETAEIAGVSTEELQKTLFAIMAGGGASRSTATSDLEKIATLVSQTNREETSLSKVLDENKVKYSETLTVAEALPKIAKLAADATAVQRLELAKTLGISRETVDALSAGPEEFQKLGDSARDAGAIIDSEVIDKADKFKREWEKATASLTTRLLAWIAEMKDGYLQGVIEATERDATILQEQFNKLTNKLSEIWQKFKEGIGGTSALPPAPFGVGPGTKLTVTPSKGSGGGIELPSKESGSDSDSFEKALEQARKRIALMEADTKTVGLNTEAREQARVVATLEEAAKKANAAAGEKNTEVTEKQRAKINELAADALKAAENLRKAQEIVSAFKEVGSAMSEAFRGAVLEGKKLDEVLNNLLKRLATRSLDKFFDQIFTSFGGGVSNALGFGGPRAGGGPVSVGKTYLVGERGPELFRPNTSGNVLANARGSGGGVVVQNHVHNNAGASVRQQTSRSSDGGIRIDTFIDQFKASVASDIASGRGAIPGAMSSRFGLNAARGNAR